ncbi:MAG: hypothetical protein ACRCWF_10655 [Beijerinckiaceae bacterium]
MSREEWEDAKRRKQKEAARRARRAELRVRLMQLRKMSLVRLVGYFLAPFGAKLEIARLTFYLIAFVSIWYLAHAYTPKKHEDRLVPLNAKFSFPCGNDIPLKALDEVTRNRLWADFMVLTTDVRPTKGFSWDVRQTETKEHVYSPERITALVAFFNELSWLSAKDRQFIMKYISEKGIEVRGGNRRGTSVN